MSFSIIVFSDENYIRGKYNINDIDDDIAYLKRKSICLSLEVNCDINHPKMQRVKHQLEVFETMKELYG